MGFPPAPTDSIDWSNVGFHVREVNGHVSSNFSHTTGKWTEPAFVPDPYLRIHGMAPGLNYGQQCYEGLKAFRSPSNQILIFRPSENAARMAHSASFISIPPPPTEIFLKAVHKAVAHNAEFVPPYESGASMYIRPLLFGSSAQLGLNPGDEYTLVVFVLPVGVYHGVKPVDCKVLEDFDRAAPDGTGSAKVGGNYAPVLVHSEKARREGYGITLHLDAKTRTKVEEFSTSGFLGIKTVAGRKTLVVTKSNSIIDSVTSRSVQTIAKEELGWDVQVREVEFGECAEFEEVMAAGTAAALVPVRSISKLSTGEKWVYCGEDGGEGVKELSTRLKRIQRGEGEDKWGWLEKVEAPEKEVGQKEEELSVNSVDAL